MPRRERMCNCFPFVCGQIISKHAVETIYEISSFGGEFIYVSDEKRALEIAKLLEEDRQSFVCVKAFELYKCLDHGDDGKVINTIIYESI